MKADIVNRFVISQVTRYRLQKCITVEELARGSGIPLGSLSNLLVGRYRCSIINLHRLLSHLGVSVKDVWPESDPVGITPQVNARTIRVAVQEAESRLAPLLTIDSILSAVSEVYGLHLTELATPSRRRDLSEARAVAAWIVSEQPHLHVVRLSEWLHRDVSTLFHVARRMRERLEYDEQLEERVDAVRRKTEAIQTVVGSL